MKTRKLKVGDVTMSEEGVLYIYVGENSFEYSDGVYGRWNVNVYCNKVTGKLPFKAIEEEIIFNIMTDMYVGVDDV